MTPELGKKKWRTYLKVLLLQSLLSSSQTQIEEAPKLWRTHSYNLFEFDYFVLACKSSKKC